MKTGNIKRAFTYLESGSVLLVTTYDGTKDNVMTISWQMVMDFTPHIAITTGSWNESFETIEQHGILVFKGVQLWENPEIEERRLIHANGDGTFFADGEFRNLREEMRQWVPEGSERL